MNLDLNAVVNITTGLDVPISGAPKQALPAASEPRVQPTQVAILGEEFVGLKPSMLVEEGDRVKKGQPLFTDKKTPGAVYTAPAAGIVSAINRGARRVLQSVVIDVDGDEQITFPIADDLDALSREQVQKQLVDSGLWTALRTRPFSRVPQLDTTPAAIFVTAMDTSPLAADPRLIIGEQAEAFEAGLKVLSKLTEGKVFLCQDDGEALPGANLSDVQVRRFTGVHPAGLVGTHIHFTMPVSLERQVWHLNYQHVIAFGKLFTTGEIFTDRIVALAGPSVKNPRLVRTQWGAELNSLVDGELIDGNHRVVSGSVLHGHNATGPHAFLGRFHLQVSALKEDNCDEVMPWMAAGSNRFSITRSMITAFLPKRTFNMSTHSRGSSRATLTFGQLDRVMPLDILPTLLLRDLVVRDTDEAQLLGALELDEEDLSLCTFVCPGKFDFGKELRACLDIIEKEG
ncbi:Na(+)-translocating NADH-quinone reductase subunit A [Ferrimonas aestuarii]|uniref:Na(+)-translocating NADH-quinone reductase subunit A n=1 Tax=Ferrimonas aestuarii TaxID=2569539 RepID=A0A4U1BPM3_9GAMM|nr:Na(+)-translocating NADH-quinone reductase subunit A [Ferrimonas aestuarii]TKB56543.1 Na(+)-translocating NADH-quinone reductase subunit A [Ferrimonas aestuarii]